MSASGVEGYERRRESKFNLGFFVSLPKHEHLQHRVRTENSSLPAQQPETLKP